MLNIPIFKNAVLKKYVLNSKRIFKDSYPKNLNGLKYDKSDINDSLEVIARGAEGSVYKVKNSNFALKVKNGIDIQQELDKPIDFSINNLDKINHVKARIGTDINIMEYIKGQPVTNNISINDLKTKSIKECLEYICNAAAQGFRHDFGGRNILYNKGSGTLIPIDFLQGRPGYKEEIINNSFIQLYSTAKNASEIKQLLSKISLAFVELLKDSSISAKGLRNLSVELKTAKDVVRCNEEFKSAIPFVSSLEQKLQDIAAKKSIQGISKEFNDEFFKSSEKLAQDLKKNIS